MQNSPVLATDRDSAVVEALGVAEVIGAAEVIAEEEETSARGVTTLEAAEKTNAS